MAWERRKRGGGNRYYYRSRRVGGRVVKEYLGRGAAAEAVATHQEARRVEREKQQATQAAAEAPLVNASLALIRFGALAHDLFRAVLVANGYHLHQGEWRRRMSKPDVPTAASMQSPEDTEQQPAAAIGDIRRRLQA